MIRFLPKTEPTSRDGCTPIDHVYPKSVHGTLCYCGQREVGVEPKRKEWEMLKHAEIKRTVRSVTVMKNTAILFFKECGHIEQRPHTAGKMWIKVRCTMCERMAREVRKDAAKRERKEVKRLRKKQKLMEQLLKRKRIRIYLKKS